MERTGYLWHKRRAPNLYAKETPSSFPREPPFKIVFYSPLLWKPQGGGGEF
uniref:Uncharacterized protein n=1 Tax=Arion vulgaris TaxID=1028688 RepID=A0A0B7BIJ1_9EUPU